MDRSGAYMARYIAKNLVAAGLCGKCQGTLAYAIGKAEPVMVEVDIPSDSTVLFPRGAESILTSASIPFEVSSKKATLGFPYVSLDVLSDAAASADFGQFIERLILSVCSFDVFACCSRYQDCSDAGTCQMSDPLYSVACQYRKNLLAGKNFYSKKSPACNRPD